MDLSFLYLVTLICPVSFAEACYFLACRHSFCFSYFTAYYREVINLFACSDESYWCETNSEATALHRGFPNCFWGQHITSCVTLTIIRR
jgi:hypothetical protein